MSLGTWGRLSAVLSTTNRLSEPSGGLTALKELTGKVGCPCGKSKLSSTPRKLTVQDSNAAPVTRQGSLRQQTGGSARKTEAGRPPGAWRVGTRFLEDAGCVLSPEVCAVQEGKPSRHSLQKARGAAPGTGSSPPWQEHMVSVGSRER